MKPLFILMTVVSSFFATASHANNEVVSPHAVRSFNRSFAGAREVQWSQEADLYKVSFQVSGQHANAFYDSNGHLVVITRNISPLQLPVVLLATVKNDYSKQWISDLIEVSDDSGTYYYITLEDGSQKVILKSEGSSRWVRHQRIEK
ncbi:hypothetical protein SAMN05444008_11084 [Cnuella takakiae]|uniref:Beta-lactamase-inhibitor-like, PepSY-like n=1 Tax=Cnuella takakiae TaxID=1302690 RepID=A0A1M5D5R6_9BACT|nr:hypothetical protein [Cnuella takakiae]OLY94100.1 hypothetical protein BUE76_21055 [Cnuella takakiae]SHF62205.1 hypothetical protein SAMN05444008_11084 [Cnuella takakiae]